MACLLTSPRSFNKDLWSSASAKVLFLTQRDETLFQQLPVLDALTLTLFVLHIDTIQITAEKAWTNPIKYLSRELRPVNMNHIAGTTS